MSGNRRTVAAIADGTDSLVLSGIPDDLEAIFPCWCGLSRLIATIPGLGMLPGGIGTQPPQHAHQTWISPSGHTAYGIIRFKLPLPVGHELALFGFLQNMKAREGEASLISKQWDPRIDGMRFVAEGGLYKVRTNLFVHGLVGWATYAGTLRAYPVDEAELALAEQARERTIVNHH